MKVNNGSMHDLKNDLYRAMGALQKAIDDFMLAIDKGENHNGKTKS